MLKNTKTYIMKTRIIALIAVFAMSFTAHAQIDRSKQPTPGPAPQVKLGKVKKFTLKNGLQVILVENHKLPRAAASLTIDNPPVFEGDKAGVSGLMGSLLGRGTTTISKDDFNEKVDYLGASISYRSSGAYARSLTKYFPEVLGLLADGVKNAQFTQEELDKEIAVTLDNLKSGEKSVTNIARRVENALIYGKNHPYGEFETKKTVQNISLEDVKNNFNSYYRPNNAYLVIVGDINVKATKKLVKKLFKHWKKGNIPAATAPLPTNVATTEVNFINMSNAVQSEIVVANTLELQLGDKEYYAALLANKILGGGGTARLFMNLREDKGYTYGSYSNLNQSRVAAVFKAKASVRNIVTDSSVVEIQKEINRIRYQKVSEEELKNAKAAYVGNFVMEVQKPATAARYALNIAMYNLPANFYESYLANINAVTIDDVQNAAIKYFKGDHARIIITGKASEVLKNLEKTVDYKINYFDTEGNPTEKPKMNIPLPVGLTAGGVVDIYIKAIGGAEAVAKVTTVLTTSNATVQGMPVVLTTKLASPNKQAVSVAVMGNVMQQQAFNGVAGYAVAQGQRKDMSAEEVAEAAGESAPFTDFSYAKGSLKRIENLDGKNAYVIAFGDTEVFYDIASGLKVKTTKTVKTPDGKEVVVPTEFTDYKAVNGVLFPHTIIQSMGPMKLNFVASSIQINTGISAKDFE